MELDIEAMLGAYVECALWSSTDNASESGGAPLDASYSADDIHPDTLATMRRDVESFAMANAADILTWNAGRTTPEEQAGYDLWLTRNGHGCGFWEDEWQEVGARLTDAAHALGTFDLYIGGDDRIHGA